jgi:adenine-specific DNA-methyltransferase
LGSDTVPGKKPGKKIEQYDHKGKTRVNNPPVGLVTPDTDKDTGRKTYSYDPHIDPTLQFDCRRSVVESILLQGLEAERLEDAREALAALKKLQEPFLNWTGKSEHTSYKVPTVSLHVHERIDSRTIIDSVRRREKEMSQQISLFEGKEENPPLRQAIQFYKHAHNWSNRLVAGDSLLVMNSLLEKEGLAGQVQMIYMDPPYGIKYGSNFQPFINKRDVKDGKDEDLTAEPEMIKAFRDTWELGIHSYLTYMRDRLLLSRELLSESGSIFVQISDENVHHVKELMDEVFGKDNFISQIAYMTTTARGAGMIDCIYDIILWYSRDRKQAKYRQLYSWRIEGTIGFGQYDFVRTEKGQISKADEAPDGVMTEKFAHSDTTSQDETQTGRFAVKYFGKNYYPPTNRHWATTPNGMKRLLISSRIFLIGNRLRYIRKATDYPVLPIHNMWMDTNVSGFGEKKLYVVQTLSTVIQRCLLMTTDPGDLVFDPTCGSGTTAYVAEQWGRRWITCDTSRVAVTLAKQRLMTAVFDYYELAHPLEGVGSGFHYKKVPHITLKSIANNEDIDKIYEQCHPAIERALSDLNKALKKKWQEWEVPYEADPKWKKIELKVWETFWEAKGKMQRQMDASIQKQAQQETLYDQPYTDRSKARVSGPFTVEAVPAPLVKPLVEITFTDEGSVDGSIARSGETLRQAEWREELLKTGIRGKNGQYILFSRIEPLSGTRYLHAEAETLPNERGSDEIRENAVGYEQVQRAAISFGPEFAPLEQRQVALAIEESQKLVPKPSLIIFAAFQMDPEAAKDIDETEWPGVTLLKVQMNPDMFTSDLKKKRVSNDSYWLIGQPEVQINKLKQGPDEGKYQIEVLGFDYYNTKKGTIESGGSEKISMWMLDTDYDGRSLYPRQVFFPMAGEKEGWSKLARNLKAEIDQELMESYRGTFSLPFMPGGNRRIAVKIIDDRGIESLKIMEVD